MKILVCGCDNHSALQQASAIDIEVGGMLEIWKKTSFCIFDFRGFRNIFLVLVTLSKRVFLYLIKKKSRIFADCSEQIVFFTIFNQICHDWIENNLFFRSEKPGIEINWPGTPSFCLQNRFETVSFIRYYF